MPCGSSVPVRQMVIFVKLGELKREMCLSQISHVFQSRVGRSRKRVDVAEGRSGRESKVVWPGPRYLEILHHSGIPVDTSPLTRLRSTFEVLDMSDISVSEPRQSS